MQKIIILAAARSGSNYLRSLLNSHPNTRMFGEVLNPRWELPEYFKKYYSTSHEKTLILKSRFDNPHFFFSKYVWPVPDPAIKLVGFKLLYGQGYDAGGGNKNKVWAYLRDCEDLKIIHLKRRNFLKREISLSNASSSGEWGLKGDNNIFSRVAVQWSRLSKIRAVHFDPKKCEELFLNNERTILEHEQYFEKHDVLSIYYEDLLDSFNKSINEIIEFVGLDKYKLKSPFLKQNPLPVKWSLKNYGELKKHFKGSRWESFFLE
jgi:LPS sulfotransferase NodH